MKKHSDLLLGREHMILIRTRIFAIMLICVSASFLVPSWCHGFSFMPNKAERIKNTGNLYEKPAKNASAIAPLKSGNTVTLISRQGEWYVAKLPDNRLGWVHQDLFTDKAPAPEKRDTVPEKQDPKPSTASGSPEVPAKKGATITLKARMGHVREAPSLDSEVKFRLKKGNSVSVVKAQENWYLVRLDDGSMGWVHKDLFSEPSQGQALHQPKMVSKPVPQRKPGTQELATAATKLATESAPADQKRKSVPQKPKTAPPKPKPVAAAPVQADSGMPEIREIRVDFTSGGEEKAIFVLNGFYPPKTFTIQDGVPKVVCDFSNAEIARGVNRNLSADGNFIQKIRIGIHNDKIRAVVDLAPDKSYDVDQTFFKKENLYTLTFKAN